MNHEENNQLQPADETATANLETKPFDWNASDATKETVAEPEVATTAAATDYAKELPSYESKAPTTVTAYTGPGGVVYPEPAVGATPAPTQAGFSGNYYGIAASSPAGDPAGEQPTQQLPAATATPAAPQSGQTLSYAAASYGAPSPAPQPAPTSVIPPIPATGGSQIPPNQGVNNDWAVPAAPQPAAPAAHPQRQKTGGWKTLVAAVVVSAVVGAGTSYAVVSNSHTSNDSGVSALSETPVHRTSLNQDGTVEQVASSVLPAVVSIRVVTNQAVEEGSGSIISSDGKVLTNNHVIADAVSSRNARITVTLNDQTTHSAHVIAGDASSDIAVVQIENVSNLPVINFGDSNDVAVGQQVVAIGSPLGLSATVTSGIVSALNRPVRAGGDSLTGETSLINAIQTDAAINPGNSGGPLVDMQGNLVGMNSVIASMGSSSTGEAGSIGLGFAIPSNYAKRIAQQLIDSGKATNPMLGVRLDARSTERGALVASVEEGGPAAAAGLKAGDLIVGVGDKVIDSADALIANIRSQEFGSTVTLKVQSQGDSSAHDVSVTLTSS